MSVNNENSKNNLYIFRYAGSNFSEIITYRKYLVEEIKSHPKAKDNPDIQSFPSIINGDTFDRFISVAKNAGFTIYNIREL